jgi:hypothetical protein
VGWFLYMPNVLCNDRLWFVKLNSVRLARHEAFFVLQTLKLQGLSKEWVSEQASVHSGMLSES